MHNKKCKICDKEDSVYFEKPFFSLPFMGMGIGCGGGYFCCEHFIQEFTSVFMKYRKSCVIFLPHFKFDMEYEYSFEFFSPKDDVPEVRPIIERGLNLVQGSCPKCNNKQSDIAFFVDVDNPDILCINCAMEHLKDRWQDIKCYSRISVYHFTSTKRVGGFFPTRNKDCYQADEIILNSEVKT